MNQQQYLELPEVQHFISWANDRCRPNGFRHQYYTLKPKGNWACHSLYHAYEAYAWGFSSFDPLTGAPVTGKSFAESSTYLSALATGLRQAVAQQDDAVALACCRATMKWGGVLRRNEGALQRFVSGTTLTDRLHIAQQRLDPATYTLEDDTTALFINSGFSKIYSLLINDFVIYDSRVGAALGLLVRRFIEDSGATSIPEILRFAYADAPAAKGHQGERNVRDPGSAQFSFPKLGNHTGRYILNNMKANWLIRALAQHPGNAFGALPVPERMRALEAALFMIGYKVW